MWRIEGREGEEENQKIWPVDFVKCTAEIVFRMINVTPNQS